jgi:hypothetical protein
MGCLEGSGVPVLYIGRTVPKGQVLAVIKLGISMKSGTDHCTWV